MLLSAAIIQVPYRSTVDPGPNCGTHHSFWPVLAAASHALFSPSKLKLAPSVSLAPHV